MHFLSRWQADYNFAAALGKIMKFCGSPVSLDNLPDDGEAQAMVLHPGKILGMIQVFENCLREACSVVGNAKKATTQAFFQS